MMKRILAVSFLICLLAIYSLLLSLIFGRPISFLVGHSFFISGLFLELIGLLISMYLIFSFYKKYGLFSAISFFVPLFLIGILLEGDWIVNQKYTFHRLNFYFWDTPIAVIYYWSGVYLLYVMYQYLGKGWLNRIKGVVIHLFIDVFITTPLAVILGFWTFKSMLFSSYPYMVPAVHFGEVTFGLLYVLFQEWLISVEKINEKLKPLISLTVAFIFLGFYAIIAQW